ncbi:MAG: nuclear transport factor 2 family protein [Alphaproteobacteria bacterium]|jgi:hypothetical protein|nr:MAG: nuclear transport factor 2 family protein [Alphaproteobacteria bacterium]
MRRTMIALGTLALSACMHASPTPPASCPAPAQAAADAAQTMRDMYAALMIDDLTAFRAATTPDFFSYDVGERFDGDALALLIKQRHAEGVVFEWNVNDPKVEVTCTTALVTYVNTGSATRAGVKSDRTWLESAALKHDGQRWRIRFFHSTAVPPRPQ